MGALKEYFLEVQDEKDEWIREQLADPEADDTTPGWFDYESKFYDMKFSETTQSDIAWYSSQTNKSLFEKLQDDLNLLREIISPGITAVGFELPLHKMVYAHSVTLLESFLADSVKSLILSSDRYMERALRHVDPLKKPQLTISLLDVWSHPQGVHGIVLQKLSEVLYHNIPKVKQIIEALLDHKLDIDISKVNQITLIRHDIAHRNGKTQEGDDLVIDLDLVENAIEDIEHFAASIHRELEEQPF